MQNKNDSNGVACDTTCDLCSEIAGNCSRFTELYGARLRQRTVPITASFLLMPSIGQLVEGYTLVVSSGHYASVTAMPSHIVDELEVLLDRMRLWMLEEYGVTPLCFEHGTPCQGTVHKGCGVYHMHLHIVPVPIHINLVASASREFQFERIERLTCLSSIMAPMQPYLLVVDRSGTMLATSDPKLPSQYMRRLLACELGLDNWNWREYGIEDRLIKTYERIRTAITISTN